MCIDGKWLTTGEKPYLTRLVVGDSDENATMTIDIDEKLIEFNSFSSTKLE